MRKSRTIFLTSRNRTRDGALLPFPRDPRVTTPLRLADVTLAYFKAVREPQTVPLRPFNVLIGRNGVGKSTLLEALHWIDTAARHTTDTACDRYRGASSLLNNLHPEDSPRFELATRLVSETDGFADYSCLIEARGQEARVESESLLIDSWDPPLGSPLKAFHFPRRPTSDGRRFALNDRLVLARLDEFLDKGPEPKPPVSGHDIVDFWRNAVFLRLEPSDLARSATVRRASMEPLLDEVGSTLPFLLEELDDEAREDLVDMLHSALPDVRGVEVFRSSDARNVDYSLTEQGSHGRREFKIPSWMLSEGTRRMTAIFALLARRPGPSLLCIEEVENGLDPLSVRKVLHYLQDASRRGIQVILTTHSPWLLDDVALEDVLVVRRTEGNTTYTRLEDDPSSKQTDPRVRPGGRYIDLLET